MSAISTADTLHADFQQLQDCVIAPPPNELSANVLHVQWNHEEWGIGDAFLCCAQDQPAIFYFLKSGVDKIMIQQKVMQRVRLAPQANNVYVPF